MPYREKYGNIKFIKYNVERFSESSLLQIKFQHWGCGNQLSMEGVYFKYFNNVISIIGWNSSSGFYSLLIEDYTQDSLNT